MAGAGSGVGALDGELAKQVEAMVEDGESNVVLALRLSKNQASWTVAGRRGRVQSKPRILAVSVKRTQPTAKLRVRIHVLKHQQQQQQGLEMVKSYKLSALTSIELFSSDSTGRSFVMVFDDKKDNAQPQWTARTIDDRNQLLVCLLRLSRENLGKTPKVTGIDMVEMALWAKSHAKQLPLSAPPAVVGASGDKGMKEEVGVFVEEEESSLMQDTQLVSKGEEEDMEALLGTYVIGIDEAEAFSERLKRELAALEAANVHAILESETLVEEVIDRLDAAMEKVNDMDEWLTVFSLKLRHMREDMETIEARNNMLEVQAVNNKALMQELDKLLESLNVPSQLASTLSSGSFDEHGLPQMMEAADWLAGALHGLEPPHLDYAYINMQAVREKKAEMERLKATFVRRATDYLRSFFSLVVDNILTDKKSQLKGTPDHKELHWKFRTYARLLTRLKSLDENAIKALRKAYSMAVNNLLRRETREFATELRSTARVKGSANVPAFLEQSGSINPYNNPFPPPADTVGVSDAYGKLLRVFLPLFAEEYLFFANFLCFDVGMNGGDDEEEEKEDGDAAIGEGHDVKGVDTSSAEYEILLTCTNELFEGVQEDFNQVIEWGYKIDPMRCITLIGQTEAWIQQQEESGSQFSRNLLRDLHTKLRQLFSKFVEEANSQIEKSDKGARQMSVLSFIPRFALVAERMEALVHNNFRDMVDVAYNKLVTTMFNMLERVANSEPKLADAMKLENYAAFQNSTYDLANTLPTLRSFYQRASDAYEQACTNYIESVIIAQFGQLFEYSQKIKELLVTIETEEIPFQIGFSKQDVRKVLKTQLAGADRSLQLMHQRLKKNLTSLDLLPSLWLKCQEDFMEKYEDLEALIDKCYPNETVSPSSEEMRDLFNTLVVQ
eukprot:TRINITY_DN726_c0_g1_i1.p1 TRINITY_DN726_c0_g1~~TRINITY_DN726_c0_g1_i1.p1  ORF type:complete len:898 (-),score=306.71 TRINITY_DN726_c0_g1_i1:217-2910(-)